MRPITAFFTLLNAMVFAAGCFIGPASAAEKRLALVIGNSAYQASPLATAANDAGLVAQTLQAAGFDVIGARDLDEDALRKSLRDFIDKASAAGPDAVTFVYLAGLGLQLEGENYFAPVDLRVSSAADVSLRALRISDYTKSLAALSLKARFFVLDGARRSPFIVADKPLAGGLALTEAEPGSLIAFNAAPGTIGPVEKGPYGAYAQALVEMIREGGLQPSPLFDRVRLRVDAATKGAEVPWDADRTATSFVFFDRASDAPALGRERVAALRERPLRDLGAQDAYAVCLERDDLAHYQQFVSDYPNDILARRVRALIAARREAIVWRRTWLVGTPEAYWSYLSRYPRGPHAWDARRRLSSLAAAMEPPPRYVALVYDVPPPPPEEVVYVDRPVIYLDDPVFALPPPPPPALVFLPPPPAYLVALAPPPPVYGVYALPTPPIVAVPTYVSAPVYVAPPPNNVIFQNIHNTTVIEQINRQNTFGRAPPSGAAVGAGAVAGAALGAAAARVALPAALQQRAALAAPPPPAAGMTRQGAIQAVNPTAVPQPGLPPAPGQPLGGRALPGANGQALPVAPSRMAVPPGNTMPSPAMGRAIHPAEARPPSPAPISRQQASRLPRQDVIERRAPSGPPPGQRAALAAQQRAFAQAQHQQQLQQAMQRRQQALAARQVQAPQRPPAMPHSQMMPRPPMMARSQAAPPPHAPPRVAAPPPQQGGGHRCPPGHPCR